MYICRQTMLRYATQWNQDVIERKKAPNNRLRKKIRRELRRIFQCFNIGVSGE